jgi:hypothetical protein
MHARVTNVSNTAPTVPKSTVIGLAEEIEEGMIDQLNLNMSKATTARDEKLSEALYNKLLASKLEQLISDGKVHLEPVLRRFGGVFHNEESNDFKATSVMKHEIHLEDLRPLRRPLHQMPYSLHEEMGKQVQNMIQKGVKGRVCPLGPLPTS